MALRRRRRRDRQRVEAKVGQRDLRVFVHQHPERLVGNPDHGGVRLADAEGNRYDVLDVTRRGPGGVPWARLRNATTGQTASFRVMDFDRALWYAGRWMADRTN